MAQNVLGSDGRSALVANHVGVVFQAAEQGGAKARFMGAAVGGWHSVTIGGREAIADIPRDRPFDRPVAAGLAHPAGEHIVENARSALDAALDEIAQPAGEVENGLGRDFVSGQRLVARPADFDAAEQIGLGAGHSENPIRDEARAVTENFGVGMEADRRPATVVDATHVFELRGRLAARIGLPVERLFERDFDNKVVGQCVDD